MNGDLLYKDESCEISFSNFDNIIKYFDTEDNKFIISDEKIFSLYPNLFGNIKPFLVESTESNKSFDLYQEILSQLISIMADKNILIIGIGGGVVCDLAGFIACTYKRGTRLTLIPTTLLAMADAAIGGKNAININKIKNIIGSYKIPENIIINHEFTKTLNNDEFLNGIAEILKISIVYNENLFNALEHTKLSDLRANSLILKEIIKLSVVSKMEIIKQDLYDFGIRRILNFGHTIGHALEAQYCISHGKSVSIGMILALKFSLKFNLITKDIYDRIIRIYSNYDLMSNFDYESDKLMTYIEQDKKIKFGYITEVLVKNIGKYEFRDIFIQEYKELIDDLC